MHLTPIKPSWIMHIGLWSFMKDHFSMQIISNCTTLTDWRVGKVTGLCVLTKWRKKYLACACIYLLTLKSTGRGLFLEETVGNKVSEKRGSIIFSFPGVEIKSWGMDSWRMVEGENKQAPLVCKMEICLYILYSSIYLLLRTWIKSIYLFPM